MAVTAPGGSVDISTVAATEVQIGVFTDPGIYVCQADTTTLPVGSTLELYAYIKVQAADTKVLTNCYTTAVGSSNSKGIRTPALCVTEGYVEYALKCSTGSLTIPCCVQLADG